MTVMILFATVEGQTGKIARFVESEIRRTGEDVILVDAADKAKPVSFDGVDKVIVAGSVHERRHPKVFEVFLLANKKELHDRKTLLLSISLSAAFPEGLEDARAYAAEMKLRTEFSPGSTALVAGAIRANKYDYFQTQVLRHVVLRGRDYDPSVDEHEFTDWDALKATVATFLSSSPT